MFSRIISQLLFPVPTSQAYRHNCFLAFYIRVQCHTLVIPNKVQYLLSAFIFFKTLAVYTALTSTLKNESYFISGRSVNYRESFLPCIQK
jgi:hypothetical protein